MTLQHNDRLVNRKTYNFLDVSYKSCIDKGLRCHNLGVKTPGVRLKWVIDQLGMSQTTFAERLEVTEAIVSKWIKNVHKPSRKNLIRVGERFGLPTPALVGFIEMGKPAAKKQIESAIHAAPYSAQQNGNGASHPQYRPQVKLSETGGRIPRGTIPVINAVPAGRGAFTNQDFAPNFSYETIDAGPWASPGSQAFFVRGDSMSGMFEDGDLVVADPTKEVVSGCYAIVQFGPDARLADENRIRRVFRTEGGTLLVPSNENYPPETVAPEDLRMMIRIIEHRRPVPSVTVK